MPKVAPTQTMTPEEFGRIRAEVDLSTIQLADLLFLGEFGAKTIRRWEAGENAIPGPVIFAMRALAAGYRPGRKSLVKPKPETKEMADA